MPLGPLWSAIRNQGARRQDNATDGRPGRSKKEIKARAQAIHDLSQSIDNEATKKATAAPKPTPPAPAVRQPTAGEQLRNLLMLRAMDDVGSTDARDPDPPKPPN